MTAVSGLLLAALAVSAPPQPRHPARLAAVDRILDEFVAQKAFPGGVIAVGQDGALLHVRPFGRLSYDPGAAAVETDSIYDLASLTKVVATTTMAMMLVDDGRLDLDARVSAVVPAFRGGAKDRVTVRHLLTHSGGLDWWAPLYRELQGREAYLARITAMDLVYEPGTKSLYSDLGLILLGEVLEKAARQGLDEFYDSRIAGPLGLTDTMYCPAPDRLRRIAPTEYDAWRGTMLRGVVHDENAYAFGGVAPHAGLFGTAPDLARFAQMLVDGGRYEGRRILREETIRLFTRPAGIPGSSRALGWDTPSEGSSAGRLLSPRSFGHTGFTGTSLWIDPARKLFVVLLTNRVHPTRANDGMREVRPRVMEAVVQALYPPVEVGLDRLRADGGGPLRGKNVGLVVHAASVAVDGRPAATVLRESGVNVVRLFSPEHGLRGAAAAGETVASGFDAATGVPVVSLHGDKTRPALGDLEGLDALVFDLQDAGVRFYTYASTLLLCLDAAAEAGIPLVVLDRPNPLGGDLVAGPESDPRDVVPASLLNMAPGPLIHGLTLGEMARYANAHRVRPASLTVIPMTGWSRDMLWRDTSRPWVPPSPNLRSPEAALAYPGACLLEATNVSEGRGTDSPFLLVGAPWLDAEALARAVSVPGFSLTGAVFRPASSRAAPAPKYLDQHCAGVRVDVADPRAVRPYELGLALLHELARRHRQFRLADDGRALDRLVGTRRLREALARGETPEAILAADACALVRWRRERRSSLLY